MKQCFCDCCGKQMNEKSLLSVMVNNHEVDLCFNCNEELSRRITDAKNTVETKFMEDMMHQPLSFKYQCE